MKKISETWQELEGKRHVVLENWRQYSALTLPYLIRPSGSDENTELAEPRDDLAGKLVTNLASKLVLALMPPTTGFITLSVSTETLQEAKAIAEQNGEDPSDVETRLEIQLSKIEKMLYKHIGKSNIRQQTFMFMQYLILTGNACMQVKEDGNVAIYSPADWVVQRDNSGNILKAVLMKELGIELVQSIADEKGIPLDEIGSPSENKQYKLYTYIDRISKDKYEITQQLGDHLIAGSKKVPVDSCGFINSVWELPAGDCYGVGHVQKNIGDIRALEVLREMLVEGAFASARTIYARRRGATMNARKFLETPNGGVVDGDHEDMLAIQTNKQGDYTTAFSTHQDLSRGLKSAFLSNDSMTRNAERVTATEIRMMSEELESALGGVYSRLANEFMLPLVKQLIKILKLDLPDLDITISTGINQLGRNVELNKNLEFLQVVGGIPELTQRLNWQTIGERIATGFGVDPDALFKSEEEVQAEMQQQQMMALAEKATPNVVNAMANSGQG